MSKPTPTIRVTATLACIFMLGAGATARADDGPTFALRAGRVYTVAPPAKSPSAEPLGLVRNCVILIENGKISAVGADVEIPTLVDVVDLPDAVVMPGLVAADSGIVPRNASEDSVGPRYRAVDSFNPFVRYDRVLAGGVTTAYLNPGRHRLITGRGAVVKLGADLAAAPLVEADRLVINLGEGAFNPPPKQNWLIPPSSDNDIEPAAVQRPSSRLGQFLQLRESFDGALAYAAARRAPKRDDRREFDDNLEALAAALESKRGVRVSADRATDIEQALAFCAERKLSVVLSGLREADRVASLIASAKAPVIVESPIYPVADAPDIGLDPDQLDDRVLLRELAGRVPIAIRQPEGAPLGDLAAHAAAAMRYGLSREQAVRAVTADAAEILGVADRVGSIQPGRDADLLILNGEPLAATTHVRQVYVSGRRVFDVDAIDQPKRNEKRAPAPLVVRAGTVWTGEATYENGAVLIEDGRIVAAGQSVPVPPRARVVDMGPDAVVTPGFIDARGHLGLEGDRTRADADVSVAKALARAEADFARVAAAGVTTVMASAYQPGTRGARISAIHTAGEDPDGLIVKETAGVVLSVRGADPAAAPRTIQETLRAARAYDESWKKYAKALEEYKAKGPQADAAKSEAKPSETPEEKPKADPLTGTWEGKVSGGPIPEPQDFRLKLKLSGEQVTGSASTMIRRGEEVEVRGTFRDNHLSLDFVIESPMGAPKVEADLDREDHLTGQLRIGTFALDVEATRVEKDAPEIKITSRRGAAKKDGKPEPPKRNEALEPYRAVLAGTAVLLVDVDQPGTIEAILPVLTAEKVPFALANADEAGRVKDKVVQSKTGVIVETDPVRRINGRDYVQSIDLSRAGVPIAFQSDAEDAARALPDRAAYHVRLGLDSTAALRALTVDAAKMLKCDDQVGVLRPGARGDVLIFSGPPLEPGTRLERVFIDGREVRR